MQAKLPLPYCTLYVVRHAQSESNASGYLAGQKDEQLTELGKQQAIALAKDLSTLQFDAIFSSDLMRAKHTAEIIAREHKLVIETTKHLRERMWGEKQEYAKIEEEKKEINRVRAAYDKIPPKERYS